MGLINLVTNLPNFYYYNSKGQLGGLGNFSAKKLDYGNDRKGGGSSDQPYIVKDIPGLNDYTVNSTDFLLRGGILTAADTAEDVSRISKFLFDTKSPNGLLFTTKQLLLERQNPKTTYQRRIYSPTSTILQTGVSAFGGHLNKQGLVPFERSYYIGGKGGYYDIIGDLNKQNINRLLGLYSSKINTDYRNELSEVEFNISNQPGILISYAGGPSTLGVPFGKTRIRLVNSARTPQRNFDTKSKTESAIVNGNIIISKGTSVYNNLNLGTINTGLAGVSLLYFNETKKLNITSNSLTSVANLNQPSFGKTNTFLPPKPSKGENNVYVFNYTQLLNPSEVQASGSATSMVAVSHKNGASNAITDFRGKINATSTGDGIPSTSYKVFNRELTYDTSITTYKGNFKNGARVLNPNIAISPDQTEKGVLGEDIIDFNITSISNGGSNVLLDFKAYIDDFTDTFNGEWEAFKYVGRGENFYKYKGYTRDFNINFNVVALSRADMLYNFRKLNYLGSLLTPDYSSVGFMRGNLVKMTLGNYFNGVPGIIKTLTYTPVFEAGWDINRNVDGTNILKNSALYTGQLPKLIKINLAFTPVHKYVPKLGESYIGIRGIHNNLAKNTTQRIIPDEDGNTPTVSVLGVGTPGNSKLLTGELQDAYGNLVGNDYTDNGGSNPTTILGDAFDQKSKTTSYQSIQNTSNVVALPNTTLDPINPNTPEAFLNEYPGEIMFQDPNIITPQSIYTNGPELINGIPSF
jgi:hypothetical protein